MKKSKCPGMSRHVPPKDNTPKQDNAPKQVDFYDERMSVFDDPWDEPVTFAQVLVLAVVCVLVVAGLTGMAMLLVTAGS